MKHIHFPNFPKRCRTVSA